jgi:hypothetical protein
MVFKNTLAHSKTFLSHVAYQSISIAMLVLRGHSTLRIAYETSITLHISLSRLMDDLRY